MNESSNSIEKLEGFLIYGGVGGSFDLNSPYLVSQHPVTTEFSDTRDQFEETLIALNRLKCQLFYCTTQMQFR